MPAVWGKLVDENLLPDVQSLNVSQAAHCDLHSAAGDPEFHRSGPRRFPRAGGLARAETGLQELSHGPVRRDQSEASRRGAVAADSAAEGQTGRQAPRRSRPLWLGAKVKSVTNLGEVSAAGLPSQAGVILLGRARRQRGGQGGAEAG